MINLEYERCAAQFRHCDQCAASEATLFVLFAHWSKQYPACKALGLCYYHI
ncbi:hypothetical protein D3C87_1199220 [compost metagenome]